MKRNNLIVFSGKILVPSSPPAIKSEGGASSPYKDFSICINESETAAAIALGRPAIELWAFTQASQRNQVVATIVGKLRTCAGETVVVADSTTFHVGMNVRKRASQLINAMLGDGACQGETTTEILVPGQQQTWIGGEQPCPINLVVLDGILVSSNGSEPAPPPYHQFFIQTDVPEKGGRHPVCLQNQDLVPPSCLKSKETRQAAVFGSLRFLADRTVVLAHQVLVSEPSYESD